MGCCVSHKNNNHQNQTGADMTIQLLQTPQDKLIKILLLGPSDSGKTTIIKQLQNMHHVDDAANIANIHPQPMQDVIISFMKTLCQESITLSEKYNEPTSVQQYNEYLRDEILALPDPYLTQEIVFKMKLLWQDHGIQATFQKRQKYLHINGHRNNNISISENMNMSHFFDKIEDICRDDYSPDFEDYVRISTRSIGCSSAKFVSCVGGFGQYEFEIPDVGGSRSERRKWWSSKVFSDDLVMRSSAIVYVVAISEYNQVLYEDNTTNRLIESLNLFKSIMQHINRLNIEHKCVVLFFNKYDLFQEKIKTIPITVAFDNLMDINFAENMNPNDAKAVIKFVARLFLSIYDEVNVQSDTTAPLRIFRTTAIDQSNIHDVFSGIAWDLVHKRSIDMNNVYPNTCIDESYRALYRGHSCDHYDMSQMTESEQCIQPTNRRWWSWKLNKNDAEPESYSTNATTGSAKIQIRKNIQRSVTISSTEEIKEESDRTTTADLERYQDMNKKVLNVLRERYNNSNKILYPINTVCEEK